MEEKNLEQLLNELAEATVERADTSLSENIKHHIPGKLTPNKLGMDTINIMIDLRIGKLAAAAIIILTMALCFSFFGSSDSMGGGIFQDGKLLAKHWLRSGSQERLSESIAETYEYLLSRKEEVVYYEDSFNLSGHDAILMHWKHSENEYKVIFSDLRIKTVSADELIKLQSQMLLKK